MKKLFTIIFLATITACAVTNPPFGMELDEHCVANTTNGECVAIAKLPAGHTCTTYNRLGRCIAMEVI